MKKIKLLLAAAALMFGGSVWAQTDVTSTYITNADFSSTDGWTAYVSDSYKDYGNGLIGTYGVRTAEDQAVSTVDETHLATEYCFGFEVRWSGNYAAYQQTTAELPVGHYELSFDVENTNSNTSSKSYNNLFYVQVGENKTTDTKNEWMSAKSSWTTHTISFDLTAASTATISLGYGTGSNNVSSKNTPTLHVSHLKLMWTDPLDAAKTALQAEIDKASLCNPKEGLADAIAAAEGVLASATTETELQEALATLQAADKDAVLRYENGLADATYAAPVVTDFVVNGTFTDNVNGWNTTGGFQNQARASNQGGAFTVPFFENWNGSAKANKMYQTINNIPNGTYRLDIAAFVNTLAAPNESQYVFANNDKTYLTTGEPTAYEVYTVVTNNSIEIGLEQTTATANWMGIDNVSLRYYGAGDVINAAQNASHKLAWEEAKAAAEAACNNALYENVTGSEKAALLAEIAKAEPSTAEGYDDAAAALTSATSAFFAAKANYDMVAAAGTLAYADPSKKPVITDETTAASLITPLRAYYESHALAEGVVGALNMTDRIANANNPKNNDGWTWTGSKNNPASNESWTDANGTNNHSYFDGGNWNGSNWTTTMKQSISLPAGKFLLTAKGRAAANTTLTMKVGENSVALPNIGSTGNVFDRGWGDASVEFTTDGNDVDIEVEAKADPTHEWFSVSDFRLVRLELYTEMATSTDYEAMADALADAKAKTLGFEKGEYAPYANVEAIQAIAVAEAVDTDAENAKSDIEAITTALGNWIANATDVDAIYNGTFAEANGTNPKGWTRSNNGWGQQITGLSAEANGVAEGTTTAWYYNTNGSWQYGNDDIYVMPLAANQAYELSFKYRKHGNDWQNWMKASVVNGSNEGMEAVEFAAAENGDTFVTAKAYFTTGAAGNYILSIEQNGNAHLTDVSLVKAASATLALDETATFSPINRTYYETVNMTRTVKDGFNTVCLPFDLTAEQVADAFGENAKVYTYSETSEDSENVTINFNTKEANTIAANVPVLIGEATVSNAATFNKVIFKSGEAQVAGNFVTFKGIYAPITVAEGDYFIGNGALCKSKGSTNLKAFRAYIDAQGAAEVKMFVGDEEIATGISLTPNPSPVGEGSIYNLAGQRLSKMQKGINIVNGKKILY